MNYVLYVLCIVVICTFRTTDALGAAYGATPNVSTPLKLLRLLQTSMLQCMLSAIKHSAQHAWHGTAFPQLCLVRADSCHWLCQAWQCWQTCC